MNPLVSIIVPVYKTKDTLVKCVNSLLGQTLKEIEIILVDDGSPDECGVICDSFLSDKRVIVIHKENGGLSSARNAGIRIANGQYIGFVDSDDYVSEDMYESLYNVIKQDNSDLSICAHYTVDKSGAIIEHRFMNIPNIIEKKEIIDYLILPLIGEDRANGGRDFEGFVWRNLYKRELLIQCPFRSERVYFAEDVVNDLEVYSRCNKISVLNRCLYYYRYNPESLSNRYRPQVYIMLNNLLEFEKVFLENNKLTAVGIQRLYATGVKFAIFSVQNVKKAELPKKIKKQELKSAIEQPEIKESIKGVSMTGYSMKMRFFIWMCRFKMANLLLMML